MINYNTINVWDWNNNELLAFITQVLKLKKKRIFGNSKILSVLQKRYKIIIQKLDRLKFEIFLLWTLKFMLILTKSQTKLRR